MTPQALIPRGIVEASKGNFEPMVAMGWAFTEGLEEAISWGLHLSVMCSEDLRRISGAQRAAGAKPAPITNAQPTAGVFSTFGLKDYTAMCAAWPLPEPSSGRQGATRPVQQPPEKPLSTRVLLMSGELDPVTPPQWANARWRKPCLSRCLPYPWFFQGWPMEPW